MHHKETKSVSKVVELTTRREVLRRGAIVGAVAFIAPVWTRVARAQSASAPFDYFISPSGSDSNPGTLASPWSLNALNSKASVYGGKRVGIIGDQGTYNCMSIYAANNGSTTLGPARSSPGYGPPAFNIANGSSSSPTYVASCNSSGTYTPRLAILDGGATSLAQSQTANPGANAIIGALNGAAYITVDGLVVQNGYYAYMNFGYATTVSPSSRSPGITVQNCHFGGTGTLYNAISEENPTYLTLYGCQGALIQNNLMDGAVNDSTNRFVGFEQWASTGTIFQYNTVIRQQANGATFTKNINNSNITYRYNYFYEGDNVSGAGNGWDLSGTSSDTSYFYNNVVVANDCAWYSPGEAMNNATAAENKVLYNNTFVALNGTFANMGVWQLGGAGTVKAYNNIINRTGASAWGGDFTFSANAPALTDYNLFPTTPCLGLSAAGANTATPTKATSIAAWAAALPSGCVGKDAHSVLGNPSFVGGTPTYPANAYQLAAGSLGKGAGSSNGTSGGSAVDMGAWGGTDVNTGQAIAQIGCNFVAGSTTGSIGTSVVPDAPVLSVS